MRINKVTYLFFALLLFCFACNKSGTDNPQPADSGNGNGGEKDTTSKWALTPVNDNPFPEAVFTDPRLIAEGQPSGAIISRLTSLVNAAPAGDTVYLSVYLFENVYDLMGAIGKADHRGVIMHVMVDASDRSNNTQTVQELRGIDPSMDIVGIHNDANSSAINHNKFALFSALKTKTGEVKNVVFTSSENWVPSTEKEIQNGVIISNKKLYNAYLGYWEAMKPLAAHGMKNYTFRQYNALATDGIEAFFYPKRKNGSYYSPDPIVNILDQIKDPAADTIQIEMPFWTTGRIGIVNKLSDLIDQGAKVEIVVRSNVAVHDQLVALANKGAYVKMYNYSGVSGVKKVQIHSKVMLIRGKWNGHQTNVIVTGSENYTGNALEDNNENNILLSSYYFKHPGIFQAYEDNFNQAKVLTGICCVTNNGR